MGASQIKNGRCHITDERVAIFIDGSNLYHALRDGFHRVDLNFGEFTRKLVGQRRLARVYYYNILQEPSQRPEGARDQQEFLETLRRTPYMEIRLGKTKLLQGVPVEKGIDIMLATDLLHFAANGLYDTAVLVSGDGDFAYAVQAVKNLGRHVEVAYFENHTSRDLLEAADLAHLLDRTFLSSLWGGKGKGGGRRRGSGRGQQRPTEGQPSPAGQPTGQLGASLGGQPV